MTDVKIIDADKAIESLRLAVAERGRDYVYSNPDSPTAACVYASNGKPMCGVGLALHKLGIPIEAISRLDACAGEGPILADRLHHRQPFLELGWEFTKSAAKVFAAFQEPQDSLEPWGVALTEATDVYDGLDEA